LNGKDHYLCPYGSKASRDEYDRLISEWLTRGRSFPGPAASKVITVAELAKAFMQSGVMPDSHADTHRAVIELSVRLYGTVDASQFGPVALKVVRERMVEAGWKRDTTNQRVHHLRRIFRWGVENELVAPERLQALNAVAGLRQGKTSATESEPLQAVVAEHVAACVPFMSLTIQTMVRLQSLTGMRSAELCIMRPGDNDTRGRYGSIARSNTKPSTTTRAAKLRGGGRRSKFWGRCCKPICQPTFSRLPVWWKKSGSRLGSPAKRH